EGVFLLVNPTALGVSQIAGVVLIGHGLDTTIAAVTSFATGQEVHTITHEAAVGLAKQAGFSDASANTIGVFVAFGGPIDARLATRLANGVKGLLATSEVTLNAGQQTGVKLNQLLPAKAKAAPVKTVEANAVGRWTGKAKAGKAAASRTRE